MEELFKICLACTSDAVEGCGAMTAGEVQAWLDINNETLTEPNECGDTKKYVVLPQNQ